MILTSVFWDLCNPQQKRQARGYHEGSWFFAHDWGWVRRKGQHLCLDCLDEIEQERAKERAEKTIRRCLKGNIVEINAKVDQGMK